MKNVLTNIGIIDVIEGAVTIGHVVVDERSGQIEAVETGSMEARLPIGPDIAIYDGTGLTVAPGFIDSHCHLNYRDILQWHDFELGKSVPESTIDAVYNASLVLSRGITTIRDCGSRAGIGVAVRNAIDAGDIGGPRAQVAGQMISTPGGLGDHHPSHLFAPNGYTSSMEVLVTDPWEARAVLRRQLKDGVDWIKVALSGTGSNWRVPAERNDLPEEVFAALMAEAKDQGARVIAHAESDAGIKRAARYGATSIEHGIYLDDEAVDLMLASEVVLVPTLAQYTAYGEEGHKHGRHPKSVEQHQHLHDRHVASIRLAYERGVPIAAGGDAGGAHFPQGSFLRELVTYVDLVGMSTSEALRTATVGGARLLGLESQLGTVEIDKCADLVVLAGDPLADIHILADSSSIVAVIQAGVIAHEDGSGRLAQVVAGAL